jgi:sirohydrochlorin ferrochelatase
MVRKDAVILLVAHGSRRPQANLEVQQVAERLAAQLGRKVLACFLESAEPNIPEGIDRALSLNPSEILVLPYFLTEGRHMDEDIPKILQEKVRAYPETPIRLLNYVGSYPGMVELLAKAILGEK